MSRAYFLTICVIIFQHTFVTMHFMYSIYIYMCVYANYGLTDRSKYMYIYEHKYVVGFLLSKVSHIQLLGISILT